MDFTTLPRPLRVAKQNEQKMSTVDIYSIIYRQNQNRHQRYCEVQAWSLYLYLARLNKYTYEIQNEQKVYTEMFRWMTKKKNPFTIRLYIDLLFFILFI